MKKLTLIMMTILALIIVTGLPSQAEDNVINGCFKKNNGQLRNVDDPSECRPSENPISWTSAEQPEPPLPKIIEVNCISPGATATPLNEHFQDDPEVTKYFEERTPTGRAYLNPEDIAGAAVFLASDDANPVYGVNLLVDDGWNV